VITIDIKRCVTCGDQLHRERAKKYDYCTKPDCRRRNARGLRMAAVGVNKAADQFVVLDDDTKREAASGRYKKQPDAGGSVRARPRSREGRASAPQVVPRSSATSGRTTWTRAQERLAITYRDMGLAPDAIAKKIGVSPRLVTQILLAAPRYQR
jgi:hypothetical protein